MKAPVYVFSGWDGEKYSDRIFRYDPDQDQWDIRKFEPIHAEKALPLPWKAELFCWAVNEGGSLKEVWNYYPDRDGKIQPPGKEPRVAGCQVWIGFNLDSPIPFS